MLVKLDKLGSDSNVISVGLVRLSKFYKLDQVSYNSLIRLVKFG